MSIRIVEAPREREEFSDRDGRVVAYWIAGLALAGALAVIARAAWVAL